jgi:zinc/manganese transport system permease protein
MILIGWSTMMLAASSHHGASHVGQALIDGQLYFTGPHHFTSAALLSIAACALMIWLSPKLMLEDLFPGHQSGNIEPVRLYHLVFDTIVAVSIAVAAIAVGIMAAFALVFLPALIAFQIGLGWRCTLWISAIIGVAAYLIAFFLAIVLDQPLGPILITALLICTLSSLVIRHVLYILCNLLPTRISKDCTKHERTQLN